MSRPTLGAGGDAVRSIAPGAAAELERYLRLTEPQVIAFGTGRALSGDGRTVQPDRGGAITESFR